MPKDDELKAIVQRMIDAGEPEDNIAKVIRHLTPQTPTSASDEMIPAAARLGAQLTAMSAQAAPAAIPATARAIANSPGAVRTVQKLGNVASRTVGGAIGHSIGGLPGALIGQGAAHGLTPTQEGIRVAAGQLGGETPEAANAAARALAIINYGKSIGIKVNPRDIVDNPSASGTALDKYAEAAGKRLFRLYDASGRIISGPQGPSSPARAAAAARMVGRLGAVGRLAGRGLSGAGTVGTLYQLWEASQHPERYQAENEAAGGASIAGLQQRLRTEGFGPR